MPPCKPVNSLDNTFYDCDEAKEGTSRRHLHATLSENVDSYSFEVSMLGYEAAAAAAAEDGEEDEGEGRAVITYSEASYHEIGRNLARFAFSIISKYIPELRCSESSDF